MHAVVMLLQLKGSYLLSNHNLIAFDHKPVQEGDTRSCKSPVFLKHILLWLHRWNQPEETRWVGNRVLEVYQG